MGGVLGISPRSAVCKASVHHDGLWKQASSLYQSRLLCVSRPQPAVVGLWGVLLVSIGHAVRERELHQLSRGL